MNGTQIWWNHITMPRQGNLGLLCEPSESLANTLVRLGRLSIPADAGEIEVHDGV